MSSSRYEIRETIGQGGLGSVLKAFDTQLQREVAMKRVLTTGQGTAEEIQTAGDKLIAEAQTLSSLNHPNIVTVFDVGQDEEGGFVVMELLDGETLDETVERGVLTAEDFKEVVFQTMEGLIAAQAANVIHRDIKPTNIMLIWQASGRFQLKILDFGLAKFSKNPSVQTMDQDDAVMGSIFFMAPEQFERTELDSRTDLYQIGCVYYNSLTGQYPFNGQTAPQVMNAHLQHKVVPLEQLRPDLPPVLCQWVMWLINRDISSRPASAKEALKYFPKDLSTAPALPVPAQPVAVVPVDDLPEAVVATPSGNAQAPPNLLVARTTTTHQPVNTATPTATAAPSTATTTTTAQSRPAGLPQPASKKQGGSSKMIIILSAISALVFGSIIAFIAMKSSGEKKSVARLEQIYSEETPQGSGKDVNMLVKFLTNKDATRQQRGEAYRSLLKLEGEDVDEAILTQLKSAPLTSIRKQLANIASQRKYNNAMPTILAYAKSSKQDSDRLSFLRAAQPLATATHLNYVLSGLGSAQEQSERNTYENMLVTIVRSSPSPRAYLDQLRKTAEASSDNEQRSLFKVLGMLGDNKTTELVDKIFAGKDVEDQGNALSAYLTWPNREPINKVATIIESGDKSLTRTAQRAYTILSGRPGKFQVGRQIQDWERGFQLFGDNPAERTRLVQMSIVEWPHPKVITMLEGWRNGPWKGDAKYERFANSAITTMRERVKKLRNLNPGDSLKGTDARAVGNSAGTSAFLQSISSWDSPDTYFIWSFRNNAGGAFNISIMQADTNGTPSEFVVYLAGKEFKGLSKKTDSYEEFAEVKLPGTVNLTPKTVYHLTLRAGQKTQPRMMDIGEIILKRAK